MAMTMTREAFAERFREAIRLSSNDCSKQLNRPIAAATRFEVLLLEVKGRLLSLDEAVDVLYRGEDESYVFIDVAHRVHDPDAGVGWVRPSGHHPRPYADVWDPDGLGPFKPIGGIGTEAEWKAAKA